MLHMCNFICFCVKFTNEKKGRVFKKALLKKEEVSISAEDSVIIVTLYLCLADWRVDVCV